MIGFELMMLLEMPDSEAFKIDEFSSKFQWGDQSDISGRRDRKKRCHLL